MAVHGDLYALERQLWCRETRFDPDLMERIFAPDFHEVGRSGRCYSRDELIFSREEATDIPAVLHDLRAQPVSDDLCLLRYRSEVAYPSGTEWAERSSLWDAASGHWQLRFHQGTPIEAPL